MSVTWLNLGTRVSLHNLFLGSEERAAGDFDAWGVDLAIIFGEQRADGRADIVRHPGAPNAVLLAMKSLTCLLSRNTPPAKSVSMAPDATVLAPLHHDRSRVVA
jgi:hypothetical protein